MVLNKFNFIQGNFSRRRKLKWLVEFFVFVFLVFHRSSFFSLAGPVFRQFFRRLLLVLNSHIFVFLVFHAMLFLVYTLSHLTDNKTGSNRTDTGLGFNGRASAVAHGGDSVGISVAPRDDSVHEILFVGEKNTAPRLTPEMESLPFPVDDSIVVEENTAKSPVNEASIGATPVEETTIAPASVVMETAEMKPEIRRYRRTESVRFEENREMEKLRRSMTAIQWESGGEAARFLKSVDEMDIEDFNRTVESFIAEQKLHIGGRISG